MWKIHGTTMWLEKLNILTNLSKSNRNYLLSCSYKGICTLYYLSSSLLIFLFYFLLLWWNIAQKAQKRIGGLLSFSSKILRLCDRYGSVNDHWNKSWASRGKKKTVNSSKVQCPHTHKGENILVPTEYGCWKTKWLKLYREQSLLKTSVEC